MAAIIEDRDVELEDGECSDSGDEETADSNMHITNALASSSFKTAIHPDTSYHARIPQIIINSDESNDDSDDDCPSAWKKSRDPHIGAFDGQDTHFVNPLLSKDPIALDSFSSKGTKKRNNVWGSVLTEQVLAQEVKTFGVNNRAIHMDSRDVESYDFTKAKEDERPDVVLEGDNLEDSRDDIFSEVVDLEKEVKKHENRKRKRNAKERIGRRTFCRQKKRNLGVNENSDICDVVEAITQGLGEPKIDLFTRIVEAIGKELAIKLYYMTEDAEDEGGMMTNDGFRRRTPGGVYIQLLKSDMTIPADTINALFEDEYQEWRKTQRERRKIKKAARRKQRRRRRREMDIDRPDTPTPAEDLEVLNALDSNNEFDATDLPERPATPEPKDDSSDGEDEDEDDEEEEDVSVAIARAKAAILQRQRELASEKANENGKNLLQFNQDNDNMSDSLKDNEMVDDGDSGASTGKMSTQDIISVDVPSVNSNLEIGEMDDV